MSDIVIRPISELKVVVDAHPAFVQELAGKLKFQPDGYKYTPKYKSGLWDGWIRLFNPNTGVINLGLLQEVVNYARDEQLGIKLEKNPFYKFNDAQEFINKWASFCAFKPHDYQIEASLKALSLNKALILSPTGSGKSFITYMILSYLMMNTNYRILISVPTTQLVEQLADDISSYEPEHFQISQEVHTLYSGKEKLTDKRITIATWQSLIKLPASYFRQFDAYICDEAHQADGKSISSIIDNLEFSSKIRIGLTGTLDGTKCHEMQLRSLFGPIVHTKTTKELMDEGYLSKLNIDVRILVHKNRVTGIKTYKDEIDYLVSCQERNDEIVNIALTTNHNTLVLFNFVDSHGKILYNSASSKAHEYGKEVYYISGETSVEEREVIRKKFATQSNVILFASLGTFSAGVNAPNIHYLVMAHPSKSRIRNLQSIGRSLRKADGKVEAILIDVADNIYPNGKKDKSYTYNHLIKRLELYESEEFDYRVSEHFIG